MTDQKGKQKAPGKWFRNWLGEGQGGLGRGSAATGARVSLPLPQRACSVTRAALRAAPQFQNAEGADIADFEAQWRRFAARCVRFTTYVAAWTYVAACHATRASGCWAAPLPDGSRTRWLVAKGFSSSHPPLQACPGATWISYTVFNCRLRSNSSLIRASSSAID